MKKFLLYPCVFGVFAVSDNKKIATLVQNNGRIDIKTEKNRAKIRFCDRFLIRGFLFFILGVYYTICGIFNYGVANAPESVIQKKATKSLNVSAQSVAIFTIAILSLFVSLFLLGYLPIKVSFYLSPKNFDIFVKRLIIALLKIVIIAIILLVLKFIPVFKNYYKFNYACNETQKELHVVNFLSYFVFSIFVNTIVMAFVGIVATSWYFLPVNVFSSLFVFMLCYEIFAEIQKNKHPAKIFAPLCSLTMQKCSHLEQKCVSIVLSELELSSSKRDNMQDNLKKSESVSFSEAYVLAKEVLTKAGKFEKSDLDFIFAEVLNKSRAEIRLVKNISKADYKKIESIVKRRAEGEPISKIFGYVNFYGLNFRVTKDVLSPRMDTERLVETVLKEIKPKQTVLDIGTGSGAIAITLAKNSSGKVTAVDISSEALNVAKQNAKDNKVKVKFVNSDLFDKIGKLTKFDIIVSNPPYIPSKDIDNLDVEVKKFDPLVALDGGEDGLSFYSRIIEQAPLKLNKNGKIFFEVGIGQANSVKKLLQKNFKDIRIIKDYNKIDRVVCATKK